MTVNLSALAGAGQQFFDNNGNPLSGGKLYSYAAGTTTPQATYTSVSGATAHTNPIILDSAGRVATGEIWVTAGQNYKFVLKTSVDVTIATWDNITGINGTGIATDAEFVEYTAPYAGAVAYTVEDKLAQYISLKDFGAVGNGIADDSNAWTAFTSVNTGMKLIPAGSYLINSVVYVYPNDVIRDNVQLFPPGQVGTENRAVENSFFQDKAATRVGASDTTPQNDERNFWRGLPSQNAWGNNADIGVFSAAFNRNGASYAAYSTTFGHDCVTYGVASIAMGAGSCTGDPDNPSSPAFQGYCSTAFGKNVQAKGEKSAAFCEETQSLSRASFTAGYASIAGEYGGSGLGASALGAYARAYGEGSFAAGKYIQSTNGGYTIGSGINSGNALNNTRGNGVALGANTITAPFYVMPGTGTTAFGDFGYAEFFVAPVRFTEMLGGTTLFTCAQAKPLITNSGGGGYGAIQFEATINGVMTSVCRVDSDSNVPSFLPTADNSRNLGSGSLRWQTVYAGTGTINTSDANEKQQVRNLLAKEIEVAKKLKGLIRAFKFNDAVEKKGSNARIHFGVIAQDVKAAFESEGLVAEEYGMLCFDAWDDVYGNNGELLRKAGSRYGVRYEELLAFIIAAL